MPSQNATNESPTLVATEQDNNSHNSPNRTNIHTAITSISQFIQQLFKKRFPNKDDNHHTAGSQSSSSPSSEQSIHTYQSCTNSINSSCISNSSTTPKIVTITPLKRQNNHHIYSKNHLKTIQINKPVHSINTNINTSTPLQSQSYLDHNLPWGDTIQDKIEDTSRFYFQNIHGLRTQSVTDDKWISFLSTMSKYKTDVFGLVETWTNWSLPSIPTKLLKEAKHLFPQVSLNCSKNHIQSDNIYLPGGCLQTTTGTWVGRIVSQLHDPHNLNRWTGHKYKLNKQSHLYVISAYRVNSNTLKTTGPISSYTQQFLGLRQRFPDDTSKHDPRKMFVFDLIDYIQSLQLTSSDHFMLMIDANETLDDNSTNNILTIMQKLHLVDLFTKHHKFDCNISTYFHTLSTNHRRIDFILGTESLLPHITKCGYVPFMQEVTSDHRGLFIDFSSSLTNGNIYIKTPPIRKIGYSTNKKEVTAYKSYILDQFHKYNIISRAEQYYLEADTVQDKQKFTEQLSSLDDEITAIVLNAERTQCTSKPPFPWTKEVHQLSLLIRYWNIQQHNLTRKKDISLQLKSIFDQLSIDNKTSILQTTCSIRTNLKNARQKKLELYRTHRESNQQYYDQLFQLDSKHFDISLKQATARRNMKKQHKRVYPRLRTVYGKTRSKGITSILIPFKDQYGQLTSDHKKAVEWTTVSDPAIISDVLLTRNINHFGQASHTPFASPPLNTTFGYQGVNENSESFLQQQRIPSSLINTQLHPGTQLILQNLIDGQQLPTIDDEITFDEFWKGIQKWDEQTSTSPSGRHLGHYKVLLYSDSCSLEYDDQNPDPSFIIKTVYYHMAMSALRAGITIHRWCNSSTLMIEKDPGIPKINRLRVIHLFEADFNLMLKLLWARKLVWHSHTHNVLMDAQSGSRPNRRCIDVVLKKEMNYLYSRLTRTSLATVDNDATACYDRIICNLAMLVSRYYGMTARACQMHASTLENMIFKVRTAAGDSTTNYTHSTSTPIHGTGQGSSASPSLWLLISNILLKALQKCANGMHTFDVDMTKLSDTDKTCASGFVDDIALFINTATLINDDLVKLLQSTEHDIQQWQQLLEGSGGKLEIVKCFFYVLSWKFNKYGDPIPLSLQELQQHPQYSPVSVTDNNTSHSNVSLLHRDIDDAHRTLGAYKTISGDEKVQYTILMEKSTKLANNTKLGHLTRFQARQAFVQIYLSAMLYCLVTTNLSQQSLDDIQSPALHVFLPAMGYEPTFPRAVVHGPQEFGGLNIPNLYSETCILKICSLLIHLRSSTDLGRIMLKNINWLQLHSGQLTPVLGYTTPLQYLSENWFLHLRGFLRSVNGTIIIPEQWLPILERQNDKSIMEHLSKNQQLNIQDLRIANNWRIYFQVTVLSDIVTPDGKNISDRYWSLQQQHHLFPSIRQSNHNWPIQQRPCLTTFHIWHKCIRNTFCRDNQGSLIQPLTNWLVSPSLSRNIWNYYLDSATNSLYSYCHDGTFTTHSSTASIKSHYTRTFSTTAQNTVTTLPNSCIPVQLIRQNATTFIVKFHSSIVNPTIPTGQLISSFTDYVQRLPAWKRDLLTHWDWDSEGFLQTISVISNASVLYLVSDGGYNEKKFTGSYGAVIANNDNILLTVSGSAPGSKDFHSPFRSEQYALLAGCLLLSEFIRYHSITIPKINKLFIYTDNKGLVHRINHHISSAPIPLGHLISSDIDVELQTISEIKQLQNIGFIIPDIEHVKAHQDKIKRYEQLTRPEQLNVHADNLATQYAKRHRTSTPYHLLPQTKAHLFLHNVCVTQHPRASLRTGFHTQDLRTYLLRRCEWTNRDIDNIWWTPHSKVLKQFSHSDKQRIQKFNINRLHTHRREQLFHSHQSIYCIDCHTQCEETHNHLLQCSCTARQQTREQWCEQIQNYFQRTNTVFDVTEAILLGIRHWLYNPVKRDKPISQDNNAKTDKELYRSPDLLQHIPSASKQLQKAYSNQCSIGWDQFIKGKFSVEWEPLIQQHLSYNNISPLEMTTTGWAVELITILWNGVLSFWEVRNATLYGYDHPSSRLSYQRTLFREISALRNLSPLLPIYDQTWFSVNDEELLSYSIMQLKAWVRNARAIVRLHSVERRRHHLFGVGGGGSNQPSLHPAGYSPSPGRSEFH